MMVFDKTGTLTENDLEVHGYRIVSSSDEVHFSDIQTDASNL